MFSADIIPLWGPSKEPPNPRCLTCVFWMQYIPFDTPSGVCALLGEETDQGYVCNEWEAMPNGGSD